MTDEIVPLYEVHILSIPIEKFAEIAIDGAIWLAGEYLSQGRQINGTFIPDPAYIHKPRHFEVAIAALDRANQRLRHQIFVEGFRKLPESGTHRTFDGLLTTHHEMLEEAFRTEWQRRFGQIPNAEQSRSITKSVANELLCSPSDPR
jgi:hypothetical protein